MGMVCSSYFSLMLIHFPRDDLTIAVSEDVSPQLWLLSKRPFLSVSSGFSGHPIRIWQAAFTPVKGRRNPTGSRAVMSSMQNAGAYGKKNLLISFDFESFLKYVNRLTVPVKCPFDVKDVPGQLHYAHSTC